MKCPSSPKGVAKLMLRIAFGGALALVGVAHFMGMDGFSAMVSSDLGPLTGLGSLWAYILPVLQVVGGALIVFGYRHDIAAWCAGLALASIAVGMMLKAVVGGADLGSVMPAVNNTFLWLILYMLVVKHCMCCGSCDPKTGGGH